MANLKVAIKRRVHVGGKRQWVDATSADPAGTFYLRFYSGSKPKHETVEGVFHDAELAALRLERRLKAHSQGFVLPEEKAIDKPHRISEVIAHTGSSRYCTQGQIR
jgi:hypothetical protein